MTRAIIVTVLLLGGATGSLLVAEAASAEELAPTSPGTVRRTVDSGAELVLSRPTFWNGACAARGVKVTVTQPPAHGTVSVTEGLNTANRNPKFGTAGRCGGMQIMGKQIVYRSYARDHRTPRKGVDMSVTVSETGHPVMRSNSITGTRAHHHRTLPTSSRRNRRAKGIEPRADSAQRRLKRDRKSWL